MTESPQTRLAKLKKELHYWQGQATIDARVLRLTMAKCKAIGAQMRALQKEIEHGRLARRSGPKRQGLDV